MGKRMILKQKPAADEQASPVTIAIGDVHGCNDLLIRLLAKIDERYEGRSYKLVFLGDYVDRGPDSRGVLDTLLRVRRDRPDSVFLKGNHEQAMLDFLGSPHEAEAWLSWGGEETLASYGIPIQLPVDVVGIQESLAGALPDSHFEFLMSLTLRHDVGNYLFVHAGLNPDKSVEEQHENDLLWIRDDFFNRGKGQFGDKVVVHGHTPIKSPTDHAWRINVDTGAVWSSKLSAVAIEGDKRTFITT